MPGLPADALGTWHEMLSIATSALLATEDKGQRAIGRTAACKIGPLGAGWRSSDSLPDACDKSQLAIGQWTGDLAKPARASDTGHPHQTSP